MGLRPFRTIPRGGTQPGEEVRDGSHADNRGGGNRGGLAPTALRLLRVGAGTAGQCTTLEAALDSHPARPSLSPGAFMRSSHRGMRVAN